MKSKIEQFFKLGEHNTTFKTEIMAGITTFFTMAYILAVNPGILSSTGMPKGAIFTATIIGTLVGTLIMAFYANYPFVLSAGMGLNAFFAFTVVGTLGHSPEYALTAVFIEGIIFIILTLFKIREKIVNCIPMVIKNAVSVGIGLFIAFIGLKQAGVVVANEATFVSLGNLRSETVIVFLIGLSVSLFLYFRNVKGAILIGILVATIAGIPLGQTKLAGGIGGIIGFPESISPIMFSFTKVPLSEIFSFTMLGIVFTFLFVDLFDTIGMLVGTASKVGMLDKDGKLPNVKKALFADAIGTTVGAMAGTSTITTFAESSAGIAEGGRTGLTSLTSAVLFGLALFLAPLFTAIPASATSSALVIVGVFMMSNVLKIDFNDFTEAVPAFVTIILMPLTYSIGDGLMLGIIAYVFCKLISGKHKENSILLYILAVAFILNFIFLK